MSTITIRGYIFNFPDRYTNDHYAPSREELDALESLRAENIRNNVSKWIAEAEAEEGSLLMPETQRRLQARIREYADGYRFAARQRQRQMSAFDVELRECAEELALAEYTYEPGTEDFERVVETVLRKGTVDGEARRRTHAKQQAAASAIDELFGQALP